MPCLKLVLRFILVIEFVEDKTYIYCIDKSADFDMRTILIYIFKIYSSYQMLSGQETKDEWLLVHSPGPVLK